MRAGVHVRPGCQRTHLLGGTSSQTGAAVLVRQGQGPRHIGLRQQGLAVSFDNQAPSPAAPTANTPPGDPDTLSRSALPATRHCPSRHRYQQLEPDGLKVMIDVGSNKGLETAEFINSFLPSLGVSPKFFHQELLQWQKTSGVVIDQDCGVSQCTRTARAPPPTLPCAAPLRLPPVLEGCTQLRRHLQCPEPPRWCMHIMPACRHATPAAPMRPRRLRGSGPLLPPSWRRGLPRRAPTRAWWCTASSPASTTSARRPRCARRCRASCRAAAPWGYTGCCTARLWPT